MANLDIVRKIVQAELAARVDVLLQRSHAELERLPACEPILVRHHGVEITFTTYRDVLDDGLIQIIMHASTLQRRTLFSKANMVLAKGFRMTRDRHIQDVPDRDLYESRQPAV